MSTFQDTIEHWPAPKAATLPIRVEQGRMFGPFHKTSLQDFVGQLFSHTEAQAIRVTFNEANTDEYGAKVEGLSCPPVPYATLSGEYLPEFLAFLDRTTVTLWLHSENWFWVADMEDEELEKLIDLFIHSL